MAPYAPLLWSPALSCSDLSSLCDVRTISAMSLFVPHSAPELFVSEDSADMSLSGLSEAVASYTAELLL